MNKLGINICVMIILLFFVDESIFPVYWIIQIQLAVALSELMFSKSVSSQASLKYKSHIILILLW